VLPIAFAQVPTISQLYGHSHSEKSEEIVKNTTAASNYIPRRPRISMN